VVASCSTGSAGVGKSTLLNLIAGLDRADEGDILVAGTRLGGLDDDARTQLRRDKIGFVFQAFHILPHLTLAQNIALPLVLAQRSGPEALACAETMLSAVGIPGRGGDYPVQLSGGEVQRIAIARALVHRPALILADEPTGNLDTENGAQVMDILKGLNRSGATIIMVTHSQSHADQATRQVDILDGQLVASVAQVL